MISEDKRIKTKAQLKEWLAEETGCYPSHGRYHIHNAFLIGENAIIRRYHILLRKTEYYMNTGKKLRASWCNMRLVKMQNIYGIHIPPNVCDRGLKIMHVGGIYLNSDDTVGKNCKFHVNTSLAGGRDGSPTIGDGVVLGMNAIVVGKVFLADNIAVAAHSLVTKSFYEEDITIGGVPAKKLRDGGRSVWDTKKVQEETK